jgi:hypothetical protein
MSCVKESRIQKTGARIDPEGPYDYSEFWILTSEFSSGQPLAG